MTKSRTACGDLFRVSLRHVCPACLRGDLFRRRYELNERCSECGQDLVGTHGAQYGGPMVLGYALGGAAGITVALPLFLIPATTAWAVPCGLLATIVTVLLTFGHGKAAWTWLLFHTGQLREPGNRPGS